MFFKKKYLLLTFLLIVVIQTLIYANNSQKVSFKYLKWSVKEVSMGKLISISFFSGLIISTLLNTTITGFKKNSFENVVENYEPLNEEEDMKSNIEMPPERDIRDAQPTISVNYRVVKNTEENILRNDQNNSNNLENTDDWDDNNNDW